jgi:hypothetical protein
MKNKDQNKRRELLALGLIAGAGALAGNGIKKIISTVEGDQKVKMMTAKGELVEVDVRHLPKKWRQKPVSNAELKEWMEHKKTASNNPTFTK